MSEQSRLDFAITLARDAGLFAKRHFQAIDTLAIESKGHQDLVSNADRDTETLIREAIARRWPDDGIVGEEHGRVVGTSGYDWVVDPIDGTANFVRGIPQWCVALACTRQGVPIIGVTYEPCSDEMFSALSGHGAFVNGRPMRVSEASALSEGSVMIGVSGRTDPKVAVRMVEGIVGQGGLFFRNASGALGLAYVAGGRLIGYIEDHMNAWDCLGGLVMIEEAGGTILTPDPATVLESGTPVIAGGPAIYPALDAIARTAFVDTLMARQGVDRRTALP